MSINYVKEKFITATNTLSRGHGKLKERLIDAYVYLSPLREEYFPDSLRDDWINLKNKMNSEDSTVSDGDIMYGTLQNTVEKMSFEECEEAVDMILGLNYRLREV